MGHCCKYLNLSRITCTLVSNARKFVLQNHSPSGLLSQLFEMLKNTAVRCVRNQLASQLYWFIILGLVYNDLCDPSIQNEGWVLIWGGFCSPTNWVNFVSHMDGANSVFISKHAGPWTDWSSGVKHSNWRISEQSQVQIATALFTTN